MSDSHDMPNNRVAAEAIQDRYQKLCGAREKAQENIVRLQSHQRQLLAEIEACVAAARLFGLDLDRPPTIRASGKGLTIKALILQAAEDAYPQPVQAADVHRQLANMGYAVHDKTVGSRISADGRSSSGTGDLGSLMLITVDFSTRVC